MPAPSGPGHHPNYIPLDATLVLMMGEFGRMSRFNNDGGRDHWPVCFRMVLAGGSVRGGQAHGASGQVGASPAAKAVSPQDLMATLYSRCGIDPQTTVFGLR